MEFRLVYQGKLPSEGGTGTKSRMNDKHRIRRAIHVQLGELWRTHPFVADYHARDLVEKETWYKPVADPYGMAEMTRWRDMRLLEHLAAPYARRRYHFLPLVGDAFGPGTETVCALDILFLRRDMPGRILIKGKGGGDIDNRLKVLFDGLRMPTSDAEIPDDATPAEDEKPFFCLLQDDSLITEVKVTTDRLLTPIVTGEHEHDVYLVIHVRTLAVGSTFADIGARHLLGLKDVWRTPRDA